MLRRKLIATASAVLLLAGTDTAWAAQPEPPDPYPVTSLLSMLDGLAANMTDPEVAKFLIESGVLHVLPRAIANNPELTDPASLSDPEVARRFIQAVIDSVKSRPTLLGSNILEAGTPYLLPDWNRNGVFAEAADYDIDNSPKPAVGTFRYPCVNADATFSYETTDGKCVDGDTEGVRFRLGQVRKLDGVVNARGMRMAAKIWLPHTALRDGGPKHPGVVFADGNLSRQSDYYVYHQRLARAGYIVLSFDQAGQGDSEGNVLDLVSGPDVPGCAGVIGACRDLQDIVRWFTGASITPVVDLENESPDSGSVPRVAPRRNPAYAPEGENRPNPVLNRLDTSRIGITGQSMGSISTTVYLKYLPTGKGADGKPLPPVQAGVAISGFVPHTPTVPLQIQTSDYDLPAADFGQGTTDGPVGAKQWYDKMRATGKGNGALSMVIIEGGTHEAQSDVPIVPRSPWTAALSTAYQVDWFDCVLQANRDACVRVQKPRPHLSRATASEIDPDGPAGSRPSYCITVPDAVSFSDPNSWGILLGQATHDCVER